MATHGLRNADDARRMIDLMGGQTHEVRSALLWLVDRVSELERKTAKLEEKRPSLP